MFAEIGETLNSACRYSIGAAAQQAAAPKAAISPSNTEFMLQIIKKLSISNFLKQKYNQKTLDVNRQP
jgi:hypothetical protein